MAVLMAEATSIGGGSAPPGVQMARVADQVLSKGYLATVPSTHGVLFKGIPYLLAKAWRESKVLLREGW